MQVLLSGGNNKDYISFALIRLLYMSAGVGSIPAITSWLIWRDCTWWVSLIWIWFCYFINPVNAGIPQGSIKLQASFFLPPSSAVLCEVPQSSICIRIPFHRVSEQYSFISRILMRCTVRIHCCNWYGNVFAWLAPFCIIGHIGTSANHTKYDMIEGECMSVYPGEKRAG